MKPDLAIRLLHQCRHAALATQSQPCPGYPYATAIQFVCDERHRPIFVASTLAEHSKNLLSDGRVSLSLLTPGADAAQSASRMTLLADAERIDAPDALRRRLLRYLPEAEDWLMLDFLFFRLHPKRARLIAGLGTMGWLDGNAWDSLPILNLDTEARLLRDAQSALPPSIRLLGCDGFGADWMEKGDYRRTDWSEPTTEAAALRERLLQLTPSRDRK
ncbi:HugZ family protein [Chromobacterium phragmitis]|uniref:Pyridoxamine 5'-phosphate oxidase n=1 Tax=Chromobacterium phragmitis TaxID=2202141 RepID=A0A344UNG5_9NEIS|nr:pyridoxamine 5'-phosphate oxidase family protein [Chromobacterium phragmitis]AXE36813.1 pyridoxamine 5'-phosphate oxidase [Chromobacterium phragmitis]